KPLGGRWVALPFSDSCSPMASDEEARSLLLRALCADGQAYELRGVSAPAPWQTFDYFVNCHIDLDRPRAKIEDGFDSYFRQRMNRARHAGVKVSSGRSLSEV